MASILQMPLNKPSKFGFERVKKRKPGSAEQYGQINMFAAPSEGPANIVRMPSRQTTFEQALQLDDNGDERAAELYREAIENGDCVPDAFCNLGVIESKAGRTNEAFDCFTRSLSNNPRHLESHYNLANLYFDIDNLALAREHYELAAKVDPSFANIYFNLGLVLALMEDYKPAVQALNNYKGLVSEEEASKADDLLQSLRKSLAMAK